MSDPNLTEIATTTLRNRGARKMPIGPTRTKAQKQNVVHQEMHEFKHGTLHSGSKQGPVVKNPKQAIAIAMSESGQAKGKKGGKDTKFHNVRHSPGGPANNDGYTPASPHVAGAGHAKQPKGHGGKLGYAEGRHTPNQSYGAEQREHAGPTKQGSEMGKSKEVAYVGSGKRGSGLISEGGAEHDSQPHGKSIGAGGDADAKVLRNFGGGEPFIFRAPAGHGDCFRGTQKSGQLRVSGHSGAHQIGKRK